MLISYQERGITGIMFCHQTGGPVTRWAYNRARFYDTLNIEYSQLSANGHSRKRTALLTDAFSNSRITSQSNSVFTHSRKRTFFRKQTRTLLKMKIGFFFCLRSLVSGHPMYNN